MSCPAIAMGTDSQQYGRLQGMSENDENSRKLEPSGTPGQSTASVDSARTSAGSDATNAGDPLIGQLFSQKYRVLSKAGRGGMSAVYKAIDMGLNRVVALKILLPTVMVDMNGILRFQQEARSASRLNNPHIIKIYEFAVQDDGTPPYLVMDYIEGTTLSELIAQEGAVDVDRCVAMFMQACDGLMHAHDNGVIHRDLKPSNLMITKNSFGADFVNIVDFGIAKMLLDEESAQLHLTQTGEVFGSPYYMSPEQCRGEILDRRSDIYALGCVMYESLTGRVPFKANNVFQTMQKHISELPERFAEVNPNKEIPIELEQIVHKSLAKSPDDRYQSMHDLYSDLKLVADDRAFVQLTTGPHAGRMTTGSRATVSNNGVVNPDQSVLHATNANAQAEPLPQAASNEQLPLVLSSQIPAMSEPAQTSAPHTLAEPQQTDLGARDLPVGRPAETATGANAHLANNEYVRAHAVSSQSAPSDIHRDGKTAGIVAEHHKHTPRILIVFAVVALGLLSLVGYCFVMSPAGSMYIARYLVQTQAPVAKLESTAKWMEQQEQLESAAVCYLAAAKPGGQTSMKDAHEAVKSLAVLRSRGGQTDLSAVLSSVAAAASPSTTDELKALATLAAEQNQSKLYSASEISSRLAIEAVIATPRAQQRDSIDQALKELQECYFNRSLYKEMNDVFGTIKAELEPILQNKEPIAYCAWSQATAKFESEDYGEAEPLYREAIAILENSDMNGGEEPAAVYYEQGQNYVRLKRDQDAIASFRKSLNLCENLGLKNKQAAIRASLADLGAEEPEPQMAGKQIGANAKETRRTTHLARRGGYYQGSEKHGLSRILSKAKRWFGL